MEISEKQQLLDSLLKGIVQVTFKKIDTGELRVMPCTLNETTLEANGFEVSIKMNADSDHYAVWALDKNAFRSFRLSTVTEWKSLTNWEPK
tara:strand:- start:793 stop:1065 length:273 start_codon:yes stop_codon:yes gene_type:complete